MEDLKFLYWLFESLKLSYGEYEYNKVFNGYPNGVKIDVVCVPEINEFRGNKKVQLIIQNYRFN